MARVIALDELEHKLTQVHRARRHAEVAARIGGNLLADEEFGRKTVYAHAQPASFERADGD